MKTYTITEGQFDDLCVWIERMRVSSRTLGDAGMAERTQNILKTIEHQEVSKEQRNMVGDLASNLMRAQVGIQALMETDLMMFLASSPGSSPRRIKERKTGDDLEVLRLEMRAHGVDGDLLDRYEGVMLKDEADPWTVYLTYFKASGRYYGHGDYISVPKNSMAEIFDDVRGLASYPGLSGRWTGGYVLVDNHGPVGYPGLVIL